MVTTAELVDCRQCWHGQQIKFKDRLCNGFGTPRPVEWMRSEHGECGADAVFFEDKDSKQYDGVSA